MSMPWRRRQRWRWAFGWRWNENKYRSFVRAFSSARRSRESEFSSRTAITFVTREGSHPSIVLPSAKFNHSSTFRKKLLGTDQMLPQRRNHSGSAEGFVELIVFREKAKRSKKRVCERNSFAHIFTIKYVPTNALRTCRLSESRLSE